MEESTAPEISPLGYLRILFRRKWFIIIPSVAGLILGICAGILMPKKYVSNTVLLVEEGKTDNPLFDKITVSTTVGDRLATIRESMLGWKSIATLVKRLNMDKDVKDQRGFEQLILKIRGSTVIKMRSPNVIDLAYVGRDPELTQAVVKNITEIFIERNVDFQNQETADAIKFIEEQLRVYRGKIKSAEIAELKEQLNALLVDSTEEHPMVKKLREQIRNKNEELEKENLEYTEDASLISGSAAPLIDEIRKAIDGLQSSVKVDSKPAGQQSSDSTEKDLYKVILLDKVSDVMGRDVKVNEEIYNMLLQRLETAKITQRLQSSKEGTRYTIIDPPRLPTRPFYPNKPLAAMVGLLIGLASGVGFVFLREFLDKSFIDVQDVREYFGQPLLGAISRITTVDIVESEKQREKLILITIAVAGVMVILVAAFMASIINK
ncbi:MAG TPA: GNVR domain-containing protein [Candidatus Omnitrophota bacterium]|nr:GNVR domain-containing protein [Candidatus Omnitrophota bacterium]HPD85169.1 GNVR domain-containing protein [Candidatus Omnitrophota bacterium]HRZ04330.1 GNVR domain-containing protein [Candidatus Omnitrophota bacterium]